MRVRWKVSEPIQRIAGAFDGSAWGLWESMAVVSGRVVYRSLIGAALARILYGGASSGSAERVWRKTLHAIWRTLPSVGSSLQESRSEPINAVRAWSLGSHEENSTLCRFAGAISQNKVKSLDARNYLRGPGGYPSRGSPLPQAASVERAEFEPGA